MSITDLAYEKGLPANLDAERFILGSVELNDACFPQVVAALQIDDFSLEKNRRIFARMGDLFVRGEKIDRVTVANELIKQGQLESVGGLEYLVSLDDGLPEIANLESYIRIVKEKAALRKMIFAAQKVINRCLLGEDDSKDILSSAQENLAVLSRFESGDRPESIAVYVNERGPQRILEPAEKDPGVPLGFASIDNLIGGGLRESQIMIVGARPSVGKTAWMMSVVEGVAVRGTPVCIFSAEMPKGALLNRMLVRRSGIMLDRFLRGGLSDAERKKMQDALAEIYELPIFIDDTPGLKASDISARVKALKEKPGLVAIDFFQLLRSNVRGNGDERYTQLANDLQILAKETGIPLIILSQLSRDSSRRVAGKKDYRPQLEDFRGSGTIEQIANIGAFLFREEIYDREREELRGIAEFIIRKNRDGRIGTAMLRFIGWKFEFQDLE